MDKIMKIKIGNYEASYELECEDGTYCVTVEERENSEIVKTGRFSTSVDNEQVATELLNLLCENQVGAVHVADVLCELGFAMD